MISTTPFWNKTYQGLDVSPVASQDASMDLGAVLAIQRSVPQLMVCSPVVANLTRFQQNAEILNGGESLFSG
jgi:hypothetical protein